MNRQTEQIAVALADRLLAVEAAKRELVALRARPDATERELREARSRYKGLKADARELLILFADAKEREAAGTTTKEN